MLQFEPVSELLTGLAINLVAIASLVGLGYVPLRRGKETTFMLATINIVVFGIAYAMLHVSLGVGAAFGLFALFGILRFRTGTLDVTEMSFLFAALALAVVNATGLSGLTVTELLLINGITLTALVGGARLALSEVAEYGQAKVTYDRADLLATGDTAALVKDLKARTGLDIHAVTVMAIDLTANTATLRLFHTDAGPRVAWMEMDGEAHDLSATDGAHSPYGSHEPHIVLDDTASALFIPKS